MDINRACESHWCMRAVAVMRSDKVLLATLMSVLGKLTVILITIWWLQIREILAVSKHVSQKFDVGRFNLRKLNELEVRKQYEIKISYRFAALETLSGSKGVNRAWENIKGNIKISTKETLGLYELKQHKPWFDEKCLCF